MLAPPPKRPSEPVWLRAILWCPSLMMQGPYDVSDGEKIDYVRDISGYETVPTVESTCCTRNPVGGASCPYSRPCRS
jgi:hypothetical protein